MKITIGDKIKIDNEHLIEPIEAVILEEFEHFYSVKITSLSGIMLALKQGNINPENTKISKYTPGLEKIK